MFNVDMLNIYIYTGSNYPCQRFSEPWTRKVGATSKVRDE